MRGQREWCPEMGKGRSPRPKIWSSAAVPPAEPQSSLTCASLRQSPGPIRAARNALTRFERVERIRNVFANSLPGAKNSNVVGKDVQVVRVLGHTHSIFVDHIGGADRVQIVHIDILRARSLNAEDASLAGLTVDRVGAG